MEPVILFRKFDTSDEEWDAASKWFETTDTRLTIPRSSLVIGRYCVLPFYEEQERDINLLGGVLVNSYKQHQYLADLRRWAIDLGDLTPRTWFDSSQMMKAKYNGPFVVKGVTNSRKSNWSTHMFAREKLAAIDVMIRLQQDSLIGQQDIVFREYITQEFRVFVCFKQIVSSGFYWTSHLGDIPEVPLIEQAAYDLVYEVIKRVGDQANFYTVDVAQTAKGDWIVIELNDGQMAGLSENKPDNFYNMLSRITDDYCAKAIL
jgi:hypothetical protein